MLSLTVPGNEPSISVHTLIAELSDLPAQPSVAMRVLQLVDDPRTDAARLGRLVETDPALAAHTLRLANAPTYGISRQLSSAREAVMVIGFELVRSLAALTAGELLGENRQSTPPGFWPHSLATAAGSMVTARAIGANEGDACSAALLHDIGAALLFRASPSRYDQLLTETDGDPVARIRRESEIFELAHPEAGAAVLEAWSFPPDMVQVQREHHRLPVEDTPNLVRIVRAGEALADLLGFADPGESVPDAVEALTAAGVAEEALDGLDTLVADTEEQVRTLRSVML